MLPFSFLQVQYNFGLITARYDWRFWIQVEGSVLAAKTLGLEVHAKLQKYAQEVLPTNYFLIPSPQDGHDCRPRSAWSKIWEDADGCLGNHQCIMAHFKNTGNPQDVVQSSPPFQKLITKPRVIQSR